MAKYYVIKNKEGRYLFTDGGYCYYLHKNICDATFFINKDDVIVEMSYRDKICQMKKDLEDCEVVECTIVEGDIEEELEVYKRALSKASQSVQYANYCTIDDNYVDFEKDFINQAREEIEKEKKNEN